MFNSSGKMHIFRDYSYLLVLLISYVIFTNVRTIFNQLIQLVIFSLVIVYYFSVAFYLYDKIDTQMCVTAELKSYLSET